MSFRRESGILLHPSSLPGRYGMGSLGPEAYRFADTLKEMGQHLWQILPLGPTGYGNSPYQSLSTFAGNHLLISFDLLMQAGLLSKSRLRKFPKLSDDAVNFGTAISARTRVLATVCRSFLRKASYSMLSDFEEFCVTNADWLDEYALFVSIKAAHNGRPWTEWDPELASRKPSRLRRATRELKTSIRNAKILQYLFFNQWCRLRSYCHKSNVRLIGDIPIFVAHDSADVWANRELFYVNKDRQPSVVAGVPPDYFSATGQRWGNPLYRWEVHEETGYAWWIKRMRKSFELVDIVRIDHFRGFEAYWEIPGEEPTAINGKWVKGPGDRIFYTMREALGNLPIIAEDLGVITAKVRALRDKFNFPGMQVLQFMFSPDSEEDEFSPESFPENCVCYTGTHDNDTTVGWFRGDDKTDSTRSENEKITERKAVLAHVKTDGSQIHWDLMQLALMSSANLAVIPLQDIMGLGSEARMNVPGRPSDNWRWRFRWEQLLPESRQQIRDLCKEANRIH